MRLFKLARNWGIVNHPPHRLASTPPVDLQAEENLIVVAMLKSIEDPPVSKTTIRNHKSIATMNRWQETWNNASNERGDYFPTLPGGAAG